MPDRSTIAERPTTAARRGYSIHYTIRLRPRPGAAPYDFRLVFSMDVLLHQPTGGNRGGRGTLQ